MNPSELPDVYRASLDAATFDAYLSDLRALEGPLEVRAKRHATAYTDEQAWTLDDAVLALEAGDVRAIQVRYALAGDVWMDTILGAGRGATRQLVRMAALLALWALLGARPVAAQPPTEAQGEAAVTEDDGATEAASPPATTTSTMQTTDGEPAAPSAPDAPAPEEDGAAEEPPAADSFPFDWALDAFTRPEVRTGYDELGLTDNDLVRFRFRFALILRPLELGRVRISARVEPQAGGAWSSGASLTDATLGLHQGYVTIAGDGLSVQVGRQELNYGEHLVIGAVPWHPIGRAFDAAKLRIDLGRPGAWLDVFGAQLVETGDNGFSDADAFLLGAYAALGGLIAESLALDVYFLEQLRGADRAGGMLVSSGLHRSTLGVRAKQRVGLVDYRVEAGLQLGRTGDVALRAYQVDAEAGVNLATDRLRLALEGFYASGDDATTTRNEGWDQLYPTAHIWLGVADVIGGRTNVAGAVLHVVAKIGSELRLTLDTHLFARPEAGALAGSGLAGFEADVGARWQVAEGLALRANYSLFRSFTDAFPVSDVAHFAEIELRYTR